MDTLSRHPLKDRYASDTEHEVEAYVQAVISSRPITDDRLDAIRTNTSQDTDLQTAICYTKSGWPEELSRIPLTHILHRFHEGLMKSQESGGQGLVVSFVLKTNQPRGTNRC